MKHDNENNAYSHPIISIFFSTYTFHGNNFYQYRFLRNEKRGFSPNLIIVCDTASAVASTIMNRVTLYCSVLYSAEFTSKNILHRILYIHIIAKWVVYKSMLVMRIFIYFSLLHFSIFIFAPNVSRPLI